MSNSPFPYLLYKLTNHLHDQFRLTILDVMVTLRDDDVRAVVGEGC